ncbi:MAG: arginase family protein [Thermoleophilaceae bacterium]
MERTLTPVGMLCRISERAPHATRELAEALADEPRFIGSITEPRTAGWEDDLREARGCLLEAGGQVDDALAAGGFPLLVAGDCGIALTTLAAARRHRPDVRVLWLDAHGDFNTPDTTESGFLGGMALAGAVGVWDPGLGVEPFPPGHVVLAGVRDLDANERELLERSEATVVGAGLDTLVVVQNALDRSPVYVHLDVDVLDPEHMAAQFPVPGGLRPDKLYDLLEAVADECEIVGVEVTAFVDADYADTVVSVLEPLLKGAHVHN